MRQKVVLSFLLFSFLLGRAAAQTDPTQQSIPIGQQPAAQGQRIPTGVQITNTPTDLILGNNELQRLEVEDAARRRAQQLEDQQYINLPPEPDTEFQDFVSSSLGYKLAIFGQNLFRNVPSTFAPLDRVPVTPDYLIGPGDELMIRAWGQIDVSYRAIVDRTGQIYLPKVGAITVAGVRYEQLYEHIRAAIARVFKNFELDVSLGRLRSIQVFVVGQVRRPGSYTISSLSTMVNALFASGGPSKRGSMRNIVLKRGGKEVTTFDLYDLIAFGDKSKDTQLLPGDVIYVPPTGKLVALAGSVNLPAIYELRERETLEDLLKYAGGLTTTAALQKAFVDRIEAHQHRTTTEFQLSQSGLRTELNDGDIIRFLHITSRFDNAITLRGNVAVPGRYPWREGMRVKDLIPNREFLVTQEFWKRQNQLALDPENLTFKSRQELRQEKELKPQQETGVKRPNGSQPRQNQTTEAPSYPSGRDQQNNPRSTGEDEMLSSRIGRTETQRIKEEELKNEIKRSGAEINWEYAVVQRINLEDLTTRLVPFNLGKAIAGDPSQNIALEPGDVVTIFSQNDMQVPEGQRTKFVRLEGEFNAAGVYQVEPGETLRHLISRVGGLTRQAYLYGGEFTRESVQEDQQKRLNEYNDELERSIERNASSQRNLSGEEAITERQTLEGQRRLLDKLRQLKATGRIVLELKPNSNDLSTLPDLVLEDGDRILIPFRPATVNVIGAVYNSNSFIFKPGKTVGDYLRVSGGPTRNGDTGHMFVIRADGTTVGGQGHNGIFFRTFNEARLMPGDTIVVPEKLDKGLILRGFKDWTQIVSTFVIGAAAAKVLFP